MPITEHEVGILSAEYESRLGPVVMLAVTTRALYIIKAFRICSLSMGHGELHGVRMDSGELLALGMAFNNHAISFQIYILFLFNNPE